MPKRQTHSQIRIALAVYLTMATAAIFGLAAETGPATAGAVHAAQFHPPASIAVLPLDEASAALEAPRPVAIGPLPAN